METVIIKAQDGYKLCLHIFAIDKPKGYVQIIHGMEEHQARYEPLAKRLNAAGYSVISSDMRGHGESAPVLGYFGENRGWYYLLSDQIRITAFIKHHFQTNQVILFSHSMGTIIARNLLQSQSMSYQKVILSGYPCTNSAAGFGIFLTEIIKRCKGGTYYSKLVQRLSVGTFNQKIPAHKTELDWISANEDNIRSYQEDPFCGQGFRIAGFQDLFRLVQRMTQTHRYRRVNPALPILALRGAQDPCTGGDQGSSDSLLTLRRAGFTHITEISYPGMRHEILNEQNNEQVFTDILHFLE